LYWGIGGRRRAPQPAAAFKFESLDTSGFSSSYDVADPEGISWSAKIGPEAQTEVVLSRVLWGIGYHQPPVYYLPTWRLERNGKQKTISNNSLYVPKTPWDGARQWFVVRDLGASPGKTGKINPRRNWLEGFEQRGFITAVHGNEVSFDYQGRHQELISMIHPADVQWAARHLGRLTNDQWRDAFRAANYSDGESSRFIHRLKEKIDDGLALRARPVGRQGH